MSASLVLTAVENLRRSKTCYCPLLCPDCQRMTDKLTINGQELEPLFLGLNEQDLVERIFMGNGNLQRPGCVTRGHRQEDDVLVFKHVDHHVWVEDILALA